MKLTDLLDQIDRLDQQATKGPWDHTVEWAEIGSGSDSVIHGYYDGQCPACAEEINDDARVAISPEDTELIALARTALPQLSAAVKGVLDVLDTYPAPRKEADPTGYTTARLALLEQRIREAITEAMEADDD